MREVGRSQRSPVGERVSPRGLPNAAPNSVRSPPPTKQNALDARSPDLPHSYIEFNFQGECHVSRHPGHHHRAPGVLTDQKRDEFHLNPNLLSNQGAVVAKSIVFDEIHLTIRIPIEVPVDQSEELHRTLVGTEFMNCLRRAVRATVRLFPSLANVRIILSR